MLASAYIKVSLDDRAMRSGLLGTQRLVTQFAATTAKAFNGINLSRNIGQVGRLAAAYGSLAREASAASSAVASLNRALAARGGSATALGQLIRAQGAASAATIAGMGRAVGLAFKLPLQGLGQGLGSAARGFGSGLGQAIRGVGSLVRSLGTLLHSVARSFGSLMRTALAPIRGLRSMLGIGGLVGAAGGGLGLFAAGRASMDMETRQADLARLTGLRGRQLEGLMSGLRGVGSRTAGASMGDVFDTAGIGARMGIEGSALTRFTRDMLKVKQGLSGIDFETATERTARLLGIFNRGAADAKRFASAMIALDNASTASFEDVLDMSTRMGPAAAAIKMKPSDLMALSAAIRQAGISRETGGTAGGQLMLAMASPKAAGPLGKIAGMSGREFSALRQADPLEAIKRIAEGLKGLEAGQAVRALEAIDVRGHRARQMLLGLAATSQNLGKFSRLAAGDMRTMAAAEDAAALKADTAAGQLQRLRNNLGLLAAEAGRALLPILKGLAEGFERLSRDLTRFFEANRGRFEAWGRAIGDNLSLVSAFAREWGTVLAIGGSVARQGFESFGAIAAKFGRDVQANLRWAAESFARIMTNTVYGLGRAISTVLSQAGANLTAMVGNLVDKLPGALGGTGGKAQVPVPGFNAKSVGQAFGNPLAGLKEAPGFGLPRGELARIAGAGILERAPMFGRLRDARDRARAEDAAAVAAEADADARADRRQRTIGRAGGAMASWRAGADVMAFGRPMNPMKAALGARMQAQRDAMRAQVNMMRSGNRVPRLQVPDDARAAGAGVPDQGKPGQADKPLDAQTFIKGVRDMVGKLAAIEEKLSRRAGDQAANMPRGVYDGDGLTLTA